MAIANPVGAPTSDSCTSAGSGVAALRVSLVSTDGEAAPGTSGVAKLSSTATRVPLLTLIVAVAVAHAAASGAARQTWYWNTTAPVKPGAGV
ncbi:MAG: hypothetical protein ACN6RD_04405 [Stenotrophomonas maltophilia]